MKKPTIVVIGSADIIKLGLIRSLGELGYKIVSIHLYKGRDLKIKPLDYYSKYVTSYYFSAENDLIDLLNNKCTEDNCKPVLFPLDDNSVYIIDMAHHILEKHFLYAHISHKECGIVELMNKSIQKQKAVEAGLNVAKGWKIPYDNGDYVIPTDIEYPCFVKGELGYEGGKKLQKVCYDYKELRKLLDESLNANRISFIAEEYLSVDREIGFMGVSVENGSIVPAMIEKTAIGKGTTNGVTMGGRMKFMHESDHIIQSIKVFLKNIQYVGITNFDFVESKGKLYFLEVNFRYAAYGYGISSAGLNLPNMFVRSFYGEKFEKSYPTTDKDSIFFNEKIGCINALEHFITWAQYKTKVKEADFLMVRDKKDPKPFRMFVVTMGLKYLKKKLHL